MKLYSRKEHRRVERQIHFGVGKSVKTACGLTLFSRHVMVELGSDFDGAMITDDLARVTCKRCLATKDTKLRRLLCVEAACPGIFDKQALCGEDWLMNHALDVGRGFIDAQVLEIHTGDSTLRLTNAMKPKDRKEILHSWTRGVG